ncbi:MAG: tryptophan synthase subunit alpha, partial [Mariprofundaceae bacterium]|nr:tryptophan synthase subunit alpha [Mariprofundaceae bacterium]
TCRSENRAALVGYLTAGDPDPEISAQLLQTLARHADIVEIGMPFSDPMADGPVIQAASERALAAGTTMHDVFRLASRVRKQTPVVGIILMGYANVAYAMGYDAFARQTALAGADGVLLVDIPPEESAEVDKALAEHKLHSIRLVAPTSSEARRKLAIRSASGFIYYVSLTGITGAKIGAMEEINKQVKQLQEQSGLPVCVGFGIKTPEQAAKVAAFADGVVVGSRFVTQVTENMSDSDVMVHAMEHTARAMHAAMLKRCK